MLTRFVLSVLLAIGCWLSVTPIANASIFSFPASRPVNLGIHDNQLFRCPKTPNCVSSYSTDAAHQVEPLKYTSKPEKAFASLQSAIESFPNAKLVTQADNYLYAEFTSSLFGFVDDVEFYLDRSAGVIHARSASRIGESDLGVNRNRIESIRRSLKASDDVA